jgi:hypothetical protein
MIAVFKRLPLFYRIALILFILAGMPLGIYASCIEPFRLKIVTWPVDSPKWPSPHDLRIAIITDPHVIWPWMTPSHLAGIVERANQLRPDIIVLLGDYAGTHPFGLQIAPERGLAPFKKLAAPCGVFAVLGNHDLHGSEGWPPALVKTGIPVLQNQAAALTCHGQRIWMAGLEDLYWQKADIEKTLAQVTDQNPVLMMMHEPDSFPDIPKRVLLSLAGHTHGGQIRLPFWGPVAGVVPSIYGNRYVYGHIVEDGKDLLVSSGLGMSGWPLRFLTVPEIALVIISNSALSQP